VRLAIIGTGLIGASAGLAARRVEAGRVLPRYLGERYHKRVDRAGFVD
jgi:threonine dehydrogenase-like Zn-dependent dehydrogenase